MGISRRRISEMRDIKNYQMLINGDWVDASDGGVFESINPSTQTVWSRVPEATEEDVNRAVSACLLYTSPSPRDLSTSRMPSSA